MKCRVCGNEIEENAKFCDSCGAKAEWDQAETAEPTELILTDNLPEAAWDEEAEEIDIYTPVLPWFRNKKIIFGILGLILIALAVIFALRSTAEKGESGEPLIYFKDNGYYFYFNGMETPLNIAEDMMEDADAAADSHAYGSSLFKRTADGKGVYYLTDFDQYDRTGKLYYKDLAQIRKSEKKGEEYEGERIASNVSDVNWSLTSDQKLFYMKDYYEVDDGEGLGTLYYYNGNEEVKIGKDVYDYRYRSGTLFFQTVDIDAEESVLYRQDLDGGAEKEKLAKDVWSFYCLGEKSDTILYVDVDSNLYKKEEGKDKEKIASNVEVLTYHDGCMYYKVAKEGKEFSLYDYVEDDMLTADQAVTEPDITDYQTEEWQDGWFGGYYSTVTDWDSYYAAQDVYEEKENRDYIRENLKNDSMENTNYELYCYIDGKAKLTCEGVADYSIIRDESNNGRGILYQKKDSEVPGKIVKLSELYSASDVYDHLDGPGEMDGPVYASLFGQSENTVTDGGKMPDRAYLCGKEQLNYFIYDEEDYSSSTLYQCAVLKGGSLGTPSKVDDDVVWHSAWIENDVMFYFKDTDSNNLGTLYYLDGAKPVKMDDDVYSWKLVVDSNGDVLYLKDYNSAKAEGTLYCMSKGKKTKIADDVNDMEFYQDQIYYVQDYSSAKGTGDLYHYISEDEKTLIDEDVVYFRGN